MWHDSGVMKLISKNIIIGVIVVFTLISFIATAVFSITVKEEEDMSRQMMAMIYKHFDIIDDPVVVRYVNKIGQRILASLPKQPFRYHFHVINESVYNAFATPAGHIFVYTGLIEAMNEEEELAGIIGHEIAHVYCPDPRWGGRHCRGRCGRSAPRFLPQHADRSTTPSPGKTV